MLDWLSANWIDVILIAGIVMVVALIVRSMVRDRKAGKSPCGCDCASCGEACAGCALHDTCHSAKQ